MGPEDAAEALKLEETRFVGEGGDLVLLHSLRRAEQAIEVASPVGRDCEFTVNLLVRPALAKRRLPLP
jgi:hypothetical protein